MVLVIGLTILAALWRVIDGRGYGPSWARNIAGLAIAMACAYVAIGHTWQAGVCAVLAWLTMIAGYTKWESWWSVARYGLPTALIGGIAYSSGVAFWMSAAYAAGGAVVGFAYVAQHKYLPWKYSTVLSEVLAGAAIIGGLSFL